MSVHQPEKSVRTERIELRVSVHEKALLEERAESCGMNLSMYLRQVALSGAARPPSEDVAGPQRVASRANAPTEIQLAQRTGLPVATCRRALEDGSWERLL